MYLAAVSRVGEGRAGQQVRRPMRLASGENARAGGERA